MTFTEAAAHVLKLVGKPLHYKEITDVAIEKGLLSHVGKSPEVTMGARLAAQVKKAAKDSPLTRVKPGVFALAHWDEKMIEDGLLDRTPALTRMKRAEEAAAAAEGDERRSEITHKMAVHRELSPEDAPPDEDEQHRAELSAAGTELFESEDDDDQPIFGGSDSEPEKERSFDSEGDRSEGKRRRRRRRGRGRKEEEGSEESDDLPAYTVSDADPEDFPEIEEAASTRDRDGDRERERGDRDRDRGDRERERGDRERERGDRERERGDRDRGDRDRDRELPIDAGGDTEASLAGVLESVLAKYDRSKGPVSLQNLADALRRKAGSELSIQAAGVFAIAVSDNLAAERECRPPRFRVSGNRVGLAAWSSDRRLPEKQRALGRAAEELREATVRALSDELKRLSQRAVGELVTVLLGRIGVKNLSVVRRPGAHGSELHLAGEASVGALSIPTAIMIRRDGKDLGRERVTELRGALHHYGPAAQGWAFSTGQVLSGAREEAQTKGACPVTLTGRTELAELCVTYGVGVRTHRIEVPLIDLELLEGLQGR